MEGNSDDPEERRRRMEANQAASNVGAILGLAIGTAMALTEEQTIQDEQDYNEFLVQMETEEDEHMWQQTM
jgi:fucose permease